MQTLQLSMAETSASVNCSIQRSSETKQRIAVPSCHPWSSMQSMIESLGVSETPKGVLAIPLTPDKHPYALCTTLHSAYLYMHPSETVLHVILKLFYKTFFTLSQIFTVFSISLYHCLLLICCIVFCYMEEYLTKYILLLKYAGSIPPCINPCVGWLLLIRNA